MAEIKPGEPFPVAPNPCKHYVFASINIEPSGADYAREVLYLDIYNKAPRGVFGTNVDARLVEILKKYFKFVDGMAFVESDAIKKSAQRAVYDYLRSVAYDVPECDP